ncbi:MAG: hypothetical protein A3H64_01215 [Candidatus Ryanbacteria bacterium RIFCSPLOWO2_02_FULL_45_11c]|uniref:Uncharacterized protein n=1 Tax=Candidatus Ryanbacteria bacterium RIFCSPLOWO2_02_FULL_45_11c TaxID=1802128 RepID=A0A1G2H1M2_9BACT|nr:MAG: hypothetical protein A3H64_01215 [Candidatus Ryanbacteria bacterium RIFCSPLOWO2_02_FULL_45_11c]
MVGLYQQAVRKRKDSQYFFHKEVLLHTSQNTLLYVLNPSALCAHKSPPFLGEIIKRRGLLP